MNIMSKINFSCLRGVCLSTNLFWRKSVCVTVGRNTGGVDYVGSAGGL